MILNIKLKFVRIKRSIKKWIINNLILINVKSDRELVEYITY